MPDFDERTVTAMLRDEVPPSLQLTMLHRALSLKKPVIPAIAATFRDRVFRGWSLELRATVVLKLAQFLWVHCDADFIAMLVECFLDAVDEVDVPSNAIQRGGLRRRLVRPIVGPGHQYCRPMRCVRTLMLAKFTESTRWRLLALLAHCWRHGARHDVDDVRGALWNCLATPNGQMPEPACEPFVETLLEVAEAEISNRNGGGATRALELFNRVKGNALQVERALLLEARTRMLAGPAGRDPTLPMASADFSHPLHRLRALALGIEMGTGSVSAIPSVLDGAVARVNEITTTFLDAIQELIEAVASRNDHVTPLVLPSLVESMQGWLTAAAWGTGSDGSEITGSPAPLPVTPYVKVDARIAELDRGLSRSQFAAAGLSKTSLRAWPACDLPNWGLPQRPKHGAARPLVTAADWQEVLGAHGPNVCWLALQTLGGRIHAHSVILENGRLTSRGPFAGPQEAQVQLAHASLVAACKRAFAIGSPSGVQIQGEAYSVWLRSCDQLLSDCLNQALPANALGSFHVLVAPVALAHCVPAELISIGGRPLFAQAASVRSVIGLSSQRCMQSASTESNCDLGFFSASYIPAEEFAIKRPAAERQEAQDQSDAPGLLRHRIQTRIADLPGLQRLVMLDRFGPLETTAPATRRIYDVLRGRRTATAMILVHAVRGNGLLLDEWFEGFHGASIGCLFLISCSAGFLGGRSSGDRIARGPLPRMLATGDRLGEVFTFREQVSDIMAVDVSTELFLRMRHDGTSAVAARGRMLRDVFGAEQAVWRSFRQFDRDHIVRLAQASVLASSAVYSGASR